MAQRKDRVRQKKEAFLRKLQAGGGDTHAAAEPVDEEMDDDE